MEPKESVSDGDRALLGLLEGLLSVVDVNGPKSEDAHQYILSHRTEHPDFEALALTVVQLRSEVLPSGG